MNDEVWHELLFATLAVSLINYNSQVSYSEVLWDDFQKWQLTALIKTFKTEFFIAKLKLLKRLLLIKNYQKIVSGLGWVLFVYTNEAIYIMVYM